MRNSISAGTGIARRVVNYQSGYENEAALSSSLVARKITLSSLSSQLIAIKSQRNYNLPRLRALIRLDLREKSAVNYRAFPISHEGRKNRNVIR